MCNRSTNGRAALDKTARLSEVPLRRIALAIAVLGNVATHVLGIVT
jgi:hypothetical protein